MTAELIRTCAWGDCDQPARPYSRFCSKRHYQRAHRRHEPTRSLPSTSPTEFGRYLLVEAREKRLPSLAAIARGSVTNTTQVSRWVAGQSVPTQRSLRKIARWCGRPVDELRAIAGPSKQTLINQELGLGVQLQDHALTPSQRHLVLSRTKDFGPGWKKKPKQKKLSTEMGRRISAGSKGLPASEAERTALEKARAARRDHSREYWNILLAGGRPEFRRLQTLALDELLIREDLVRHRADARALVRKAMGDRAPKYSLDDIRGYLDAGLRPKQFDIVGSRDEELIQHTVSVRRAQELAQLVRESDARAKTHATPRYG